MFCFYFVYFFKTVYLFYILLYIFTYLQYNVKKKRGVYMKTKSTLTEIAEKAGVSIATVSRILNDTGRVSPATQQKVMQAIRELESDATLRMPSYLYQRILVLVPDFFNPFYANIIDGIQQTAHNNNFEVFLMPTKDNYTGSGYLMNMIKKEGFSGVLWVCSTPPTEILSAVQHHFPTVMCCEYPEDFPCSFVSIDDVSAGFRAANYLISTGCRKIGMVNCSLRYKYARSRREGYLKALMQNGLEYNPEWYVSIPTIDYTLAYSAIMQALNADPMPDAVFACSDVYAAATINAAKNLGIRVPEDLSVIGVDNVEASRMTHPTITTIAQPGFQMGQQACSILVEKISNPELPDRRIFLNTELIIRESTH